MNARSITLGDVVQVGTERGRTLTRDIGLVVAGSLLVAATAKVQILRGPVPMTLQTVAVLFVGMVLGSRRGAAAMGLYLAEGFAGLPVFAWPVAGPAYFAGPTAGFLLAFPVAAFVVGFLAERRWDRRFSSAFVALLLGNAIILGAGLAWLAVISGWKVAGGAVGAELIGWDLLKLAVTAMVLPAGWRIVRRIDRGAN